MQIAIGSTNPVKCNATRAVLTPLFSGARFVVVDVLSGVAAQPWGDVETRTGALNRAQAALQATGATMAVGMEGGVLDSEFGLMTCAWCVVVDQTGRVGVGGNSCVLLPPVVAAQVRQGHELGTAIDRLANAHNTKHGEGAIGILTGSLETRQSAYESILRLALAPFQNPNFYPEQFLSETLVSIDSSMKRGKS